jgi:hypothetical protein
LLWLQHSAACCGSLDDIPSYLQHHGSSRFRSNPLAAYNVYLAILWSLLSQQGPAAAGMIVPLASQSGERARSLSNCDIGLSHVDQRSFRVKTDYLDSSFVARHDLIYKASSTAKKSTRTAYRSLPAWKLQDAKAHFSQVCAS